MIWKAMVREKEYPLVEKELVTRRYMRKKLKEAIQILAQGAGNTKVREPPHTQDS